VSPRVWALVAVVLLTATAGARAQAAGLAAFTGLQLGRAGSGGEQIRLLFREAPPFYNVSGDGSTQVRVDLLETSLTAGAITVGRDNDVNASVGVAGPHGLALTVHTHDAVMVETSVEQHAIVVRLTPVAAHRVQAVPTPAPLPVEGPRPPRQAHGMTVFRLRYADVSEIAGVLVAGSSVAPNDVFAPQPSAFSQGVGTLGYQSGFGQQALPFPLATSGGASGSFGERVSETLAIDRRLNAIVVYGDAEQTELVRRTVAELDVPLRTVLLETSIVELTESAARDVGVDFSAQGVVANASLIAKKFEVGDRQVSLQASIYAAVQNGQGKILARPRILAQDGRTASILTGDAIPIITSISFPATGSSVVQQQVQYINVGVNVQIRPQIGDGTVTSHIYTEVSSVTGFIQNVPRISQRQATTAATIRDGDSLVIGGLVQESELNSLTRVPFLGDLPLIGALFRLSHQTHQRTNLYILVTPHIEAAPEPRAPTK
jgi:general secretion pathway protein D